MKKSKKVKLHVKVLIEFLFIIEHPVVDTSFAEERTKFYLLEKKGPKTATGTLSLLTAFLLEKAFWLTVSIAGVMNRVRKITSFLTFGDE